MQSTWMKLGRTVLLLFVALLVLGAYVQRGTNGYHRAMFSDMVHGTAYKPFVTRALAPAAIRTLASVVPDETRRWIGETVRNRLEKTERDKWLNKGAIDATEFIAALGVFYLSILGFALALRGLARTFYRLHPAADTLLPIIATAGLPCFFAYYNHVYDLTHVFLFTLGLVLLARRRMVMYAVVFLAATVSKETSILLLVVFLLTARSGMSGRPYAGWAGAQAVIFVGVRLAVAFIFRANPGGAVEFHVRHNVSLSPYAFGQFLALVAIGLAVVHGWSGKPLFLRRALWIGVPLVLLTFLFGYLDEYRDYYEVYPVVFLLAAHSVSRLFPGTMAEETEVGGRMSEVGKRVATVACL